MTFPESDLPGGELIATGLRDLGAGTETIGSLLVSIGAPRLSALRLRVPRPFANPERRLYHLLALQYGDGAHGRYNALVRQLVSYQRAVACAR